MSAPNGTEELLAINDATQVVFRALLDLSDNARQRVMQSVSVQLGLTVGSFTGSSAQVSRDPDPCNGDPPLGDFSTDRNLSPKSFMLEKRPQSDVERVACLAYYLTHYRDTPYFQTLDISKLNTDAAQQKLTNPSYSFNNAVKAGYIVSGPKGHKQLSAAGELFVQALPDREKAKEAMTHARPRRNSKKKTAMESKNA